MIENQSDNVDIKEDDFSHQDNAPENNSSAEEKLIDKIVMIKIFNKIFIKN